MNTTTLTASNDQSTGNKAKATRVRRSAAPAGIAAALVLAIGLSACGTDQAVKRTTVDAETTTSVPTDQLDSTGAPVDSPVVVGEPGIAGALDG